MMMYLQNLQTTCEATNWPSYNPTKFDAHLAEKQPNSLHSKKWHEANPKCVTNDVLNPNRTCKIQRLEILEIKSILIIKKKKLIRIIL